MPAGADRRHRDHPAVGAAADQVAVRGERERGDPDPLGGSAGRPGRAASGGVGAQVHAERRVGARCAPPRSRRRSSSRLIVAEAMMPRPPAARGGRGQAGAGRRSPCRSARSGGGAEQVGERGSSPRPPCSRRPAGSSRSRISAQLGGGRLPGLRARRPARRAGSRSPPTTSATRRRDAPSAAASPVRGGEVEHGEVGDHDAGSRGTGWPAPSARPGRSRRRRPCRPARRTTRGRVPGHPVAGRVVDGVAGRAAHAEQLRRSAGAQSPMQEMFWLPYRSIWLGAHHHVPAAGRHHAKTARYGSQPSSRSDRRRSRVRLAVGEQQVGREGEPGQPGAEAGDQADRAGQDLAVAAPRLGARDHADLGAAHAVTAAHADTAAW